MFDKTNNDPRTESACFRRYFQGGALASVLMGGLMLGLAGARAADFDFTMAIQATPGDLYGEELRSLPDRVAKATNGRVKITLSDSLVSPAQIATSIRSGTLPMAAGIYTYLAAEEPRMAIFNLPGLINNIEEYQKVRDAFWSKDTDKIWKEKWNAIDLGDGAWCRSQLFSTKPIRTIKDFAGKRIRVHNPQAGELVSALGAVPTPIPADEILPALERGVIDGAITSACVGQGADYWRVTKYIQDWGAGPITGWAILINQDVWASLPPDLQAAMKQVGQDVQKDAFGRYNAYVNAALDKMRNAGADVWAATPEQSAEINSPKYSQKAYDAWYARAKAVGFDGQAYIRQVREVLGKSNP